jgi:aminocarboxymuconate-semialdehyde decarboxylase
VIVDAHAHIVVRDATAGPGRTGSWRPQVTEAGGRSRIRHEGRELTSVVSEFTDPGRMAQEAAARGIGHLLLSPWVRLLPFEHPLAEAREICRVQNDALAALVAGQPDRFSALGAVPLQDPATAASDLLKVLADGLAGVELTPGIAGRYLGDDAFEPFWEAAEDAGALLFIHPATRGLALPVFDDYYLWNSVANPVETATAAAHLVMAGVLERHPRLKIVLAHGGGALWAVRGRLRRAHAQVPAARSRLREPPDASLARFYHDTVTHDPVLLRRLIEDAGPDHVLLGSDRPFDMGSDDPVGEVRALALPAEAEAAVLGGNAARLLSWPAGAGQSAGGPPSGR